MGNGIVVPGVGGIKRQSSRASAPMLCGMHRRASYLAMYFLCVHLGHSRTRTSSDDTGRRANIKGVVPISRPDDIHHGNIVINGCSDRPGSQQACGDGQQLRSPLKMRNVKYGEECTDLCRVDCPCNENVLERELQIVVVEVLRCLY